MASEQDQLLEQLKEIVASLKDVGQYSKDLAAAVATANRPMQQMSDYSKAIGEQMKNLGAIMDSSKEAMDGVATDMSDILNKVGQINQGESEAVRNLNEKKAANLQMKTDLVEMKMVHEAIKIKQDEFWLQETTKGKERNEAMEKMGSLWDQAKKKAQEYQVELAKTSATKQKIYATATQAMTGNSNMSGALGGISSSISSLLPVAGGLGGILGMMMYGKKNEAEFNALGEAVGQQFDAVGGHTAKFSGRMGGLAKDLSAYAMIAKEDLGAVAGAMAELGMTQDDAETKIKGFKNQAGNDFMAFSLSMDKAFEMAAGSTAKLAGVLKRDFGQSTKEATDNLLMMASAAKEVGANVTTFTSQVMDSSSSIRLMHANMTSIIALQAGASKAFQKLGVGTQQANAYAAEGTAQVAGAIGGMDKGVMAILAQRMLGGDAGDALASYRSMAARGGGELDTKKMMQEMVNLMKESGATTEFQKQEFGMGVLGLGVAGTDALLRGVEQMNAGGEASQEVMEEVKKALGMESKKTSVMERIANEIKNAVADVMVGLLEAIINGLKLVYNGLMFGFHSVVDALTIGGSKEDAHYAAEYKKNLGENIDSMKSGFGKMGKGFRELKDAGGLSLDAAGLTGGMDVKAYKDAPTTAAFYNREKALREHLKNLEAQGVKGGALIKAQRDWETTHVGERDFEVKVGEDSPTSRAPTVKVTVPGRQQKDKGSYGPKRKKG